MNVEGNGRHDRTRDRVTVPDAANLLGVSQSAVRKRIQRGTVPWDKDDEGRIYVYVDPTETKYIQSNIEAPRLLADAGRLVQLASTQPTSRSSAWASQSP